MSKKLNATAAAFVPGRGFSSTPKKEKKLSHRASAWKPPSVNKVDSKALAAQQLRKAEEEKRRQEQQRIAAEEAKRKKEEEERVREEEEKLRKEEEERKQVEEQKRQEEEKRRQEEEERRQEEEERRQEEERKKAEEEENKRLEEESLKSRNYTRDFLLSFKERFTDKPTGLDVSKHAGMGKDKFSHGGFSRDNFGTREYTPRQQHNRGGDDKWRQNRPNRREGGGGNGRFPTTNKRQPRNNNNNRRHGGHGRRDQNSAPMDIEIKALEKTDNRYVAADKDELPPDDILKRKINSLLNKLTPEKFESLVQQFFELEVDNVTKLDYVVSCVFEKALVMPGYTPTYANFCKILSQDPKYHFTEGATQQSFKRKLLNKCQEEFEKGSGEDEKFLATLENEDERTTYLIKTKQRRLGSIRFIGELYCRGLINPKIVYVCFGYLLPNPATPDEEAVEALCKLFHTIGAQLWKKEADKKNKKGLAYLQTLNSLVVENKIKQSRVRFLIQDTIDMAKRGWVARLKKEEAKTIAEIHAAEAEKERAAKAASTSRRPNNRHHQQYEQPRPSSKKVYHSNRPRKQKKRDADGWESTPQKPARTSRRGQPKKPQQPERRFSARGRGGSRSGGRGRGSAQPDKPAPQKVRTNIYALLGGDESSDSAPSSPATPASQTPMPVSQPPPLELETPAEEETPLTKDEIKQKTNKIRAFIAEYFSAGDVEEVKTCIAELKTTQLHGMIVFEGFGAAFEKKENEQKLLGDLFETLITAGILSKTHIRQGYDEMMEWGNDFAPDYPFMFKILGVWTARLILHSPQTMDLAYLASTTAQQLTKNLPKFVAATLQEMTTRTDADRVKSMVDATPGFDVAALGLTAEILASSDLSFLG